MSSEREKHEVITNLWRSYYSLPKFHFSPDPKRGGYVVTEDPARKEIIQEIILHLQRWGVLPMEPGTHQVEGVCIKGFKEGEPIPKTIMDPYRRVLVCVGDLAYLRVRSQAKLLAGEPVRLRLKVSKKFTWSTRDWDMCEGSWLPRIWGCFTPGPSSGIEKRLWVSRGMRIDESIWSVLREKGISV